MFVYLFQLNFKFGFLFLQLFYLVGYCFILTPQHRQINWQRVRKWTKIFAEKNAHSQKIIQRKQLIFERSELVKHPKVKVGHFFIVISKSDKSIKRNKQQKSNSFALSQLLWTFAFVLFFLARRVTSHFDILCISFGWKCSIWLKLWIFWCKWCKKKRKRRKKFTWILYAHELYHSYINSTD